MALGDMRHVQMMIQDVRIRRNEGIDNDLGLVIDLDAQTDLSTLGTGALDTGHVIGVIAVQGVDLHKVCRISTLIMHSSKTSYNFPMCGVH